MATATHGRQRAQDWDAFSENYHADSVTPFAQGVRFRLRADLRRLLLKWQSANVRRQRVFVDFGCGPGDALELVAGKAPLAVGIDFAPQMLSLAAGRLRHREVESEQHRAGPGLARIRAVSTIRKKGQWSPLTLLVQADMRKLQSIRRTVDAATSINSICASNSRDAYRMFREMARSLRSGGVFFVVWPALESLAHLFDLERRAGDPLGLNNEILNRDGVNVDATGYALKLFREDEIRQLCEAEGLAIEVIEKLRYPWEYMKSLGWGFYPRRARLWDWYLIARAK